MATQLQASPEMPRMESLLRMGPSPSQLGLIVVLAAGLTLAVGVVMWAMRPTMVPLDVSYTAPNANDVMARIRSMNVPFEVDQRTGRILVPSAELQNVKLQLSGSGLVNVSDPGIVRFGESEKVGISDFVLKKRYQHALEAELGKSIAALAGVSSARVHLALPARSSFVRRTGRASAAVALTLPPGRALDAGQIQGIANFLASSVPGLQVGEVSILDQHGNLLSQGLGDEGMALSNRQLDHKRAVERDYIESIQGLLTPIVGFNGMRAQVHATLDFSQRERSEEAYSGAPEKVRSEQIEDQRNGAGAALGVPGALTNQPPDGGTLAQGEEGGEAGGPAGTMSKSTTRNYELDKTVTRTRTAPWRVERLSVAVLVDDKLTTAEDGTVQRAPREQAEIDMITGLVKEAVGFTEARGDSVVVTNSSFETPAAVEPLPEPPVWEQSWFESTVKNSLAALLIALVLLLVLRPAVRALTPKPEQPAESADGAAPVEDDELGLLEADRVSLGRMSSAEPLPPPPRVYGDILNLAREMAADDPKRVAMTLRRWVDGDE